MKCDNVMPGRMRSNKDSESSSKGSRTLTSPRSLFLRVGAPAIRYRCCCCCCGCSSFPYARLFGERAHIATACSSHCSRNFVVGPNSSPLAFPTMDCGRQWREAVLRRKIFVACEFTRCDDNESVFVPLRRVVERNHSTTCSRAAEAIMRPEVTKGADT